MLRGWSWRLAVVLYLTLSVALCIPSSAAYGAVTVAGKVLDENGAPLRDVRVTVSSGGTSAGATSDAAGIFRLEIPESGNYRVEAQNDGYFLFTEPSVELSESAPLEIRMNRLKDLAESVDVHYSPPVIDPQQTSDTKKLNSQEILNVPYPASQDYRSALPLMPGAIADNSGQLHFNGGNSNETSYRLDGFEVSDPSTGALNTRLNVDTVQEIEWNSSRFGPDQGKGSAGTIDIKTEMGDDHWRFGGTNFVPGFGTQDGFHLNHWSPRVKVSGPLRKGRVWFENSFDTFYSVGIVSGLPKGQDQTTGASGSNLSRVQWNIGNSNILIPASFLVNLEDDTRNGLSIFDPAETTLNRRVTLFLGTVKDQWMVGGGLIEFGFADTAGYRQTSPQGQCQTICDHAIRIERQLFRRSDCADHPRAVACQRLCQARRVARRPSIPGRRQCAAQRSRSDRFCATITHVRARRRFAHPAMCSFSVHRSN